MALLVDHHPSVIKNVFPTEAINRLCSNYTFISRDNLRKIMGFKRTKEFEEGLIRNIFPHGYFYEEFNAPVLSLWFYKNLEEMQSQRNKNALRAHGFSHGILEALYHPEYTHLFRRIIEIIDDIILTNTPKESTRTIINNQLIITSLLPTEELKATYLTDYFLADQQRKKKLMELKERNLTEMKDLELKFEWAYVIAAKSFCFLNKELGLSKLDIEKIIRICNAQVNIFEIRESENWNPEEDKYLSNLPFFLTVLDKAEKITSEDRKNMMKKIKEIILQPVDISYLKIISSVHIPKLEIAKRGSIDIWKTWKLEHALGAIHEGNLAQAALFDLSDFIVSSLIITQGGTTKLAYEILIPEPLKYEELIYKIVLKTKFLLLNINPTFNYELLPAQGHVVKSYENFIFPKIVPKDISKVKEKLDEEGDYCKEIEKELIKYAKISKLQKRMELALNLLSSPKSFHMYKRSYNSQIF